MTHTYWVAVCSLIATLILHSYSPAAILSWAQRQRRQRALVLMCMITSASILGEIYGLVFAWRAANLPVALLVGALYLRHLRQSGSRWCGPRFIGFTRLAMLTAAFFWAFVSLYRPESWIVLAITCGFWNAWLLRKENAEITEEFSQLKTRLASLYAEQMSHSPLKSKHPSELRDNSREAS
jgi:hypothetical protein